MGKKRATTKRKKSAGRVKVQGAIPAMELTMPLDEKKIKAIQTCLDKGRSLKIKVSRVDFAAGRLGDAWIYD